MKDVIGSAHMTLQGSLTSFTKDRFRNPDSSLALNTGWTKVPSGIYFDSTEFTISVWIYPNNVGFSSRIIDFGNGQNADNILLSLSQSNSLQPYFQIYTASSQYFSTFSTISSKLITLNQWQFLTATFNGINARIYLNGTLKGESTTQSYTRLTNVYRSDCYIGKSNWYDDGYSNSYLDDLRFYNKSLTQEEIIELMNYNQNEKSLFSF
jgi:hypothetical protein